MIILEMEQGSPEWLDARVGIPTASQFSRIITAKTRKASSQAAGYLHEKSAEYMLGEPLDNFKSQFMERGNKIEKEARKWYEFETNNDVREVGFCLRDDRLVGCSPDGLVGDDGVLEIKCPGAKQHVAYMDKPEGLLDAYRTQVQGILWLTCRQWCDIVSYNPGMQSVIYRAERDEPFIATLAPLVDAFIERLRKFLIQHGYIKPDTEAPQPAGATKG